MKKYPLLPINIKYKGIFDLEGLYNMSWTWLKDRKYDPQEDKYKNKPESPWGYEHEIKIRGEKEVDAFYKYEVKIALHCFDTAEIEYEGRRLMNGRIWITISATITTDYTKRFDKNKFTKWLENIYNNSIIDMEIDLIHLDAMHYRLHTLQQDMKKHLNMYADANYYKGA